MGCVVFIILVVRRL